MTIYDRRAEYNERVASASIETIAELVDEAIKAYSLDCETAHAAILADIGAEGHYAISEHFAGVQIEAVRNAAERLYHSDPKPPAPDAR